MITEELQRGDSFGSRLSHAIECIFSKGFNALIALGNDTPSLDSLLLQKAAESVLNGEQVLGPSKDGGCYLLGLQAASYNRDAFLSLPWQKTGLLVSLTNYLKQGQQQAMLLKPLSDLDGEADICDILRELGRRLPLMRAILRSFQKTQGPRPTQAVPAGGPGLYRIPFNKGSPVIPRP